MHDPTVLNIQLDGAKMRTTRSLYPRIAQALQFPAHFGKNLDALFDCLCDLSSLSGTHQTVVLTIAHSNAFLSKEKPERRAAVLQVFRDAEMAENRYDAVGFRLVMG